MIGVIIKPHRGYLVHHKKAGETMRRYPPNPNEEDDILAQLDTRIMQDLIRIDEDDRIKDLISNAASIEEAIELIEANKKEHRTRLDSR